MPQRPHILILGAGFGGVYAAKKLAASVSSGDIDVTVVSSSNSFLFTPLLHEVATGALSPSTVAEPLREIFVHTCVRLVLGTALSIDAAARSVAVDTAEGRRTMSYDRLVIATGAETNYYGIAGAAEHCLPLKTLSDATAIRSRVIDMFERASVEPDAAIRRQLLAFAVVGGGATGVETAAELAEFVDGIAERYHGERDCPAGDERIHMRDESSVTVVHAGAEMLEPFHPSLRAAARRRLEQRGIVCRVGASVVSVSPEGIALKSGESIAASTVIWAAGVKARVPAFVGEQPAVVVGRLAVDAHFNLVADDRIFALGDAAAYVEPSAAPGSRPLPLLAQVAQQEASVVAQNVLASVAGKPLRSFSYHSKGSMVSIGQRFAIGQIYAARVSGIIAWLMWRTIYLSKFASWRKRLRISFEWLIELGFPRDITKIS